MQLYNFDLDHTTVLWGKPHFFKWIFFDNSMNSTS